MPCEYQPCCPPDGIDLLPLSLSLRVRWPPSSCVSGDQVLKILRRTEKVGMGVSPTDTTTNALSYSTDSFFDGCGKELRFELSENMSLVGTSSTSARLRLIVSRGGDTEQIASWKITWGTGVAIKADLPAGSYFNVSAKGSQVTAASAYSSGINGLEQAIVSSGISPLAKSFFQEAHNGWSFGSIVAPLSELVISTSIINDAAYQIGNWHGVSYISGTVIDLGPTKYGNGGWVAFGTEFAIDIEGPKRPHERKRSYVGKSSLDAQIMFSRYNPNIQGELVRFLYSRGQQKNCNDCGHMTAGIAHGDVAIEKISKSPSPLGFDPSLLVAEITSTDAYVPSEIAGHPYAGAGDCAGLFVVPKAKRRSDGSVVDGYPELQSTSGPRVMSVSGRPQKTTSGAIASTLTSATLTMDQAYNDIHFRGVTTRSSLRVEAITDVRSSTTSEQEMASFYSEAPIDMNSDATESVQWVGSFRNDGETPRYLFSDPAYVEKSSCARAYRNCPGSNIVATIVPSTTSPMFSGECTRDADVPTLVNDVLCGFIGQGGLGVFSERVSGTIPRGSGSIPAENPRIVFARTPIGDGVIYGTTGITGVGQSINSKSSRPFASEVRVPTTSDHGVSIRYFPTEIAVSIPGAPLHFGSFRSYDPGIVPNSIYCCTRLDVTSSGSPDDYTLLTQTYTDLHPGGRTQITKGPYIGPVVELCQFKGPGKLLGPYTVDGIASNGTDVGWEGAKCDITNAYGATGHNCVPVYDIYDRATSFSDGTGALSNPGVSPGRPRSFAYSELNIFRSELSFDPPSGSVEMSITYLVTTLTAAPYEKTLITATIGNFQSDPPGTPPHETSRQTYTAKSSFQSGTVVLRKAKFKSLAGEKVDECLRPNSDRSRVVEMEFVSDEPASFKAEKVQIPGFGPSNGDDYDSSTVDIIIGDRYSGINKIGKISQAERDAAILRLTGGDVSRPLVDPEKVVVSCSYSPPSGGSHDTSSPIDFSLSKVLLSLESLFNGPEGFADSIEYSLPDSFPDGYNGLHVMLPDETDSSYVEEVVGPPYVKSMLISSSWVLQIFTEDLSMPQARRVIARYALTCTPKSRIVRGGDTYLQRLSADMTFGEWPFYLKVTCK